MRPRPVASFRPSRDIQCQGDAGSPKLEGVEESGYYDLQAGDTLAPIVSEALTRIAGLYAVEADIRGVTAESNAAMCVSGAAS